MDGEMNMRNHGYFAKWQNGGGEKWCSMVDGNSRYHGLVPLSSEVIAGMAYADIKNIAGDDQATLTDNQNYANIQQSYKIYVCELTTDASQLTATSTDY